MHDAVLACSRWLENTPWGVTVRDSAWMYPVIQWIHFVGLSMWLGTTFTVDLRLMGVGERRQTAAELSNGLFAWNWIGFGVAVLGGFLSFSAEATTYVTEHRVLPEVGRADSAGSDLAHGGSEEHTGVDPRRSKYRRLANGPV